MKVHEIRNIIEQWAKIQKRTGINKQADALLAFSKSLSSADQLTISTMLKKITDSKTSKKK